MTRVIAVAFQPHGQLHHLDAGGLEVHPGDWVLHPTPEGNEVARCVWGPEEVSLDEPLPTCAGLAGDEEVVTAAELRRERDEIGEEARRVIADSGLPMEVLAVDLVVQGSSRQVAVYYRAPHRVDFRSLVGTLARRLRARVDLRQVSGRGAARLVPAVGVCGRQTCCTTFLAEPEPISLRLAGEQGFGSNPLAVTGMCGKLMCCLRYEDDYYRDFDPPALGQTVHTPHGEGRVTGADAPSATVTVSVDGQPRRCPLVQVCATAQRRRDHVGGRP